MQPRKPTPGDGATFAKTYKPERVVRCTVCRIPDAAKFVAEVAKALEDDPSLVVPVRVLRDELEKRFGYRSVVTALARHIQDCLKSRAWGGRYGGAR